MYYFKRTDPERFIATVCWTGSDLDQYIHFGLSLSRARYIGEILKRRKKKIRRSAEDGLFGSSGVQSDPIFSNRIDQNKYSQYWRRLKLADKNRARRICDILLIHPFVRSIRCWMVTPSEASFDNTTELKYLRENINKTLTTITRTTTTENTISVVAVFRVLVRWSSISGYFSTLPLVTCWQFAESKFNKLSHAYRLPSGQANNERCLFTSLPANEKTGLIAPVRSAANCQSLDSVQGNRPTWQQTELINPWRFPGNYFEILYCTATEIETCIGRTG